MFRRPQHKHTSTVVKVISIDLFRYIKIQLDSEA